MFCIWLIDLQQKGGARKQRREPGGGGATRGFSWSRWWLVAVGGLWLGSWERLGGVVADLGAESFI